ncbi:MAG: MFS domain-containing protein [Burkholderia sp.]|jgi:MFS transporter, UMF1 family
MQLFPADAIRPGVAPREVLAWAAFDFANSGYTTVVLTAVFNAYFVSRVAGGGDSATFLWTCVIAAANAISMLMMPVIGALADAEAAKKRWLAIATAVCIAGTLGLMLSGAGTVVWSAAMVIVSCVAYNVGESLNSAFLPELAREDGVGRVSGWGWSFGYCGGMLTLGLCLAVVFGCRSRGLSDDAAVAGTMAVTAAVFAVAALPLFFWLKERSVPRVAGADRRALLSLALESFREIRRTFASLGKFRDFAMLAVCGFCYQCGVSVVITLAAVYASAVMGFTTEDTILLVFLVNITAAAGAFGFGYAQDRLGHKKALALTLLVWIAMVVIAACSRTRFEFWIAANLAGLAMGSSQSAGRALVAVFAPKSRLAEFYSFWNMALWLSSIVGPLSYGAITWASGNNQRLAIMVTGLFFVAALLALAPISLKRGAAAKAEAEREEEAT